MSFASAPNMAFVVPPAAPASLRQTAFLGNESPSSRRLSAARYAVPSMNSDDSTPLQPPEWFRNIANSVAARAGKTRSAPREYRTMADATKFPDLAGLTATVVNVAPVCPSREHVQLTLDVTPAGLSAKHVFPGQFVQLVRDWSGPFGRKPSQKACFATIASPPGGRNGCFEFLVAGANDPLGLSTLKPGERVRISSVMGSGLDYSPVVESGGDLHLFVDAPQGFAAAKSLIEWGSFRSASGEGANRTNHITIYYAIPSGKSLPFADRFSAWSVYGVNVVPLPGLSVMEYLSAQSSLGRAKRSLTADVAMGCVARDETFEALFCSLILFGFRRSAIHRFTQEVIADEAVAFDNSEVDEEAENQEKPFGMPEEVYQRMKRDSVERELWEKWVQVREEMRAEFESKWAAQAKVNKEARRGEAEKQQAWASWCAKNKDKWSQVEWDNDQWSRYWSTWGSTQDSWTSKNGNWSSHRAQYSGSGGSSSGQGKQHWNQQNSQEYWDWVAKGSGRGASSSGYNGKNNRNTNQTYQKTYGGSHQWGNANDRWSGYQKGGYRYQHEETQQDKKGYSRQQAGGSYSGSGTGWSGWNQNTTGNWWSHNTSQGRRSSSSGSRNWNPRRSSSFGELDFYAVLGIDSGASRADIKRAYRRKAMEHHPDRNPGRSEEAHVKMKEIVVAWSVLKDDDKRRKYDQHGPSGL